MSKVNNLKIFRSELNSYKVSGNYPEGEINVFVANHNELKDIFYLPMAMDEEVVSMISARLLFKASEKERYDMVNKYLNGLPIEAHGGPKYANMCLEAGTDMLKKGISICIFPEGAYVDENIIYRGRTGAARMLFDALDSGLKVNIIPVSINIKNEVSDLDDFTSREDEVEITFLDKIDIKSLYERYMFVSTPEDRNEIYHSIIDTSMSSIATSLNRPYVNEYIKLRPKGNVMYNDGTTIPVDEAQKDENITRYKNDIDDIKVKILSTIK